MTYKLTCEALKTQGELIAAVISETIADDAAIGLTESPTGWRVEIYCETAPDLGLLRAALTEALGSDPPPFHVEELAEADWIAIAQRGLAPVRAGPFIIHGSHDRKRIGRRRFAIEIEAGRAFGTAHHGTTQGCLTAIGALARRQRFANVLDIGTGSGILAAAAARAGAARILATDIDPVAASVARENCRKNVAEARVTVIAAPGLTHPEIRRRQPFDLIMANILAKPLLAMAPEMRRATRPDSLLILSGLLNEQAREVWGRYRSIGFQLRSRLSIEGWTTLILARR